MTIVLKGDGDFAAELKRALTLRGNEVARAPALRLLRNLTPPPEAALYVAPDPIEPPEPGMVLAGELTRAYRFGLAVIDAFDRPGAGRIVYVVRSFASLRAAPAFAEAGILGAALTGVVRALAARTIGTPITVNLVAVGLLARPGDERLAQALAGPFPGEQWVAMKQGRLLGLNEIADCLAFLLSPASSLMNGAIITADATLSTRL
jgi:NAD(P)-dependent dehydrogenase (short-subunit alcohol dehydrogenase family)